MRSANIRSLDFTLLLVMRGLLRHGRTTDVAGELGLSQPAVSHALRRLRSVFEDPLFVRKPHGLTPTRHALALAPLVESMLATGHDALGISARFDAATSRRDFRIASPDLLGPVIAPLLLEAFEREAPAARFALRTLVGSEAVKALRLDQLDVAIGQFPKRVDGVRAEHLFDDEYVLATRERHPTAGAAVTRRLLAQLGFVAINAAGEFRGHTDADFARGGMTRRVVASVPRFATALEVVRRTDAGVLVPRRITESHARVLRLELRTVPIRMAPFRVLLATRPGIDAGRDWLAAVIRSALAA
jgi:DNA-binding transcriptional LysR family regulator